MLTVVCVNWRNYEGAGEVYVTRLRGMVTRHLTVPHQFVCLTEAELGTDLKGYWAKLKLTQPGRFAPDEDVLYLDLDVVITANIDHLVALAATDRTKLWIREDFSYPYSQPRQDLDEGMRELLGGPGCCNSSVMLWTGDALVPVWEEWQRNSRELLRRRHGDQNVISPVMWPDRIRLLPKESVQSFKYGIQMRGEKPAPIVVFHGRPKVTDLPRIHPVRTMWDAA